MLKKKKCIHENYNKEVIEYDVNNSRIVTECDFCGREIYSQAKVSSYVYEEATCTKTGLRTEYWEVPNHSELDCNFLSEIPLKDHNFITIKDHIDKYLLLECHKTGTDIILPDNVNGKPYEITAGALSNLTNIRSITLKTINTNHFINCKTYLYLIWI